MQWSPKGSEPVLWMSPVASLAHGKSIRGGVPICWPWFGPHGSNLDFPSHGFARTAVWEVASTTLHGNGSIGIGFRLAVDGRELWSCSTTVEMRMLIGSMLEMELVTENMDSDRITVSEALHAYFSISDIREISVAGLDGCDYLDKVGATVRRHQRGDIRFDSELDRIYMDQGQDVLIEDRARRRTIRIEKLGSHSTVVWNPWLDKCRRMGDFGSDDGYLGMVCVESANAAEDVVHLAPGDSHRLWVRYSVEG